MPGSRTAAALGIAIMASVVALGEAAAQVTHEVGLSFGRAFMADLDDPDPSGSSSVTATFERRSLDTPFSLGVEAGLHEYLTLRQDLPPDVTGWSSKFEDTRKAWRVTPFARLGTRGASVRVYGQIGMGLYVQERSSLNQQHEGGVLVVDEQYAATEAGAGIHLGLGLGLFPGKLPVGLGVGFRSHAVLGGGDWFHGVELGVHYRWGGGERPAAPNQDSTPALRSLPPPHQR